MKYGYTIIYVNDVKKTMEFYTNAFGFKQKFVTPEHDYGELTSGETTIAFASQSLGKSNFSKEVLSINKAIKPFGVEMVFVTENIESDFKKAVAMGAVEFEEIIEKPWGQKVGYLLDNNGFLIEICTPVNKE